MRRTIQFIFFFLLSAITLQAQVNVDLETPTVYTIQGLDVEGSQQASKNAIILSSGLSLGDQVTLPGPELAEAIHKLWEKNIFDDIDITVDNVIDDKIFLLIKVVERPTVVSFSFTNCTKSQKDDLSEKMNFITGRIWTPEKRKRSNRIIQNYFMEKSFLKTSVEYNLVDDPIVKGKKRLSITVNKGDKIKINEIKIAGNQDFSDKRLKKKMKELKEKRWWRLWAKSKYLKKKMDESKVNLVDFYRENGYRDAEIVSDTFYDYDEKTVDVEMKVYEGGQYYIRNIDFSGNYKYTDDSLRNMLDIEKGDIYNSSLLDRKLNGDMTGRDVSGLYLDDGYLFFNVQPVEIAVVGDSIDLELRIFEGPQATIRKIIIEGNTKTSDYVILRELRTIPGQKFSRADLIRSQREILNLGYFNQETLQMIPIPDPVKGTVDIKYIVEEKPSDQLQIQGGWGGQIRDLDGNVVGGGFVGTVQLGFNNFSTRKFFKKGAWNPIPAGDGQKLNLAVQMNGVGWQNYSLSFLEPWLGGKKPNSLGSSVYYTINQSPTTGFSMKTIGGGFDYGLRMKWPDDFFRSMTSLSYKYYDIRNGNLAFTALDFDDAFINIISLRQTFDRTSVDAPIYPRSGSRVTFSVEATPPFSLVNGKNYNDISDAEKFKFLEYHKWSFTGDFYFEIAKNLVLRPKVQIGYLGGYNEDYGISPFERYYLGGSGLGQFNFYGWEYVGMRGYPDNSIGPRPLGGGESTQSVGGNILNKYILELRYPISLNQAAPIWVLGFAEAGNSWLGFESYKPFELKRSAGVGVRVMLPMVGLLGVDWGYGFDKIVPTSTGRHGSQFTFIIGQEF